MLFHKQTSTSVEHQRRRWATFGRHKFVIDSLDCKQVRYAQESSARRARNDVEGYNVDCRAREQNSRSCEVIQHEQLVRKEVNNEQRTNADSVHDVLRGKVAMRKRDKTKLSRSSHILAMFRELRL